VSVFVIRRAQPADLPHVIALIRALADFEELTGPDDSAAARLTADFLADRYGLLVAERGDRVVGYALFFMTYSTFLARPSLYLEDLFVAPESRRLGIATAFLRELARQAVARGAGRFEWSVLDWNEPAQQFYRSMGAENHPQWRICRVQGAELGALAMADEGDEGGAPGGEPVSG
jgi:GNAT superfamily N-acetyltransferase